MEAMWFLPKFTEIEIVFDRPVSLPGRIGAYGIRLLLSFSSGVDYLDRSHSDKCSNLYGC